MENLTQAIEDGRKDFTGDGESGCKTDEGRMMQVAAINWASASLRTFTGELLVRALAISAALSEFVTEFEDDI